MNFISSLFDASGFPARWNCGKWSAGLGWTHIISDLAIFGAYAAIPIALAYFVLRKRDVPFQKLFWLFGLFILSCGTGHLIEAIIFWHPVYRLAGFVKVITAIISWLTVATVIPVLPKALSLPGLEAVNSRLQEEILERKRAEERFRLVVESAPTGIVMIDREGRIVLINAQTEILFGYARDELIGRPVELLLPRRFSENHPKYREAYLLNPEVRSMGIGRELSGQRRDGSEFPVEVGLNPIQTSEGFFILSSIVDITERLRAEEARSRLATVVDSADDAIISNDLAGNITTWNPGAERLFGYLETEILGHNISELIPADRYVEEKQMLDCLTEVHHLETQRLHRDGSLIDVSVTISPMRDAAGNVIGTSRIIHDITARKRAEEMLEQAREDLELRVTERTAELQAANHELEAFSYSVSHDLRAPLRAIDGFSRILMEEHSAELSEDAQEFLRDVRSNTQQMGHLVDDLLTFSRLGRQAMRKQRVSMGELVQKCLDDVRSDFQKLQVEIRLHPLPDADGDPALLKQVWLNLITNAFKYSSRRESVLIEIGSTPGDSTRSTSYFVKDNGVGFDMQYAQRLFGVFQRLHRSEDYEGTGVGLAIVQRIVHRHGGRVWAEAEPDRGAVFYFTLEPDEVRNA